MSGTSPLCLVETIVSGGQTGVDRAALDVAIHLGIPHAGWCPKHRLAEDGPIPAIYQLCETDSVDYAVRTERNVIDSDGTLVLYVGTISGGTYLTGQLAHRHRRPVLKVDLTQPSSLRETREWLHARGIRRLNVAGPRESTSPGVGRLAERYLFQLLSGDTDDWRGPIRAH